MKTKLNFWVSTEEKHIIMDKVKNFNFNSLSDYLRFVALNSNIEVSHAKKDNI